KSAAYSLPDDADPNRDIDLVAIYNAIAVEPFSAAYDPETHEISESVVGVSFDMNAAQRAIDDAAYGEAVTIPLVFTEPETTKESLEALLFRDILSERTTNIAGTSNRLNNITLAAAACNGLVLNPGETFSFNESLGERTSAKGYKEAGAYAGGKTVQEIGGGICQVSSTLYYCVLYADLEVVTRSNHMFIVTYLPVGVDATVNWGSIDFKFKNDTEYPIRIETVVSGRSLAVKLVGTRFDKNYIKVESSTVSQSEFDTVEMEDETVEPGTTKVDTEGHPGYVVDTYKCYYDADGTLLKREFITRSTYRAMNTIILVPVGTLIDPSAPPESPTPDTYVTPPPGEELEVPTEEPASPVPPTPTPTPTPEVTPPDSTAAPEPEPQPSGAE
ncbi:MAG: VanW family protein, partial [Oscillospiraceae bacterium]|nr:VanW family protein [Oscillospiraceae bacterium]